MATRRIRVPVKVTWKTRVTGPVRYPCPQCGRLIGSGTHTCSKTYR